MRFRRVSVGLTLAVAVALGVTACGSSSKTTSSSTTSPASGSTTSTSAAKTIKLGLLTDVTGISSATGSSVKGVDAYIDYINSQGGVDGAKLSLVTADTGSTPAGALAGAQKLVESDHVFAIISGTSFYFEAQAYLLKQGVPVLGLGFDGPEWNDPTQTNLFSYSVVDQSVVYSTLGNIFKSLGVTSCSTVGYSDSPSAAASARNTQSSCQYAGLTNKYLDLVKFSTTDVGPIVLAIKNSGANGLYLPVEPSIGFAIAAGLEEQGVKMKAVLFPIGYGGDLLSSPTGVRAAQGFDFSSAQTPTELNTSATQLQSKWLATQGVSGSPTLNESVGWLSTAAFVAGLQSAGADASQAAFTTAMRAVKGFTAGGLLPSPVDFSVYSPAQSCYYVVSLQGKVFVPLRTTAFCGGIVGKATS